MPQSEQEPETSGVLQLFVIPARVELILGDSARTSQGQPGPGVEMTFSTVQRPRLVRSGRVANRAKSGREVGGFRKGCSGNRAGAYGSSPAQTSQPAFQKIWKSNPKRSWRETAQRWIRTTARVAPISDLSRKAGARARTTTATPTRRAMYLKRLTINVWRTILVTHPAPEKMADRSLHERTQP